MFKPVRLVATAVFLGSVGLVFVGAFVLGNEVCVLNAVPTLPQLTLHLSGTVHQ